jgi:hypothetical protein
MMGQNLGTCHFSVISRLEELERQAGFVMYPFIPLKFQFSQQRSDEHLPWDQSMFYVIPGLVNLQKTIENGDVLC